MNRPCAFCGAAHRWFDMPVIGVQRVCEGQQALELRNDPHGSTLAEIAGHVLAAKVVRVGDVRITEASQ